MEKSGSTSIFPLQNTRLHLRYRHIFIEEKLLDALRATLQTGKRKITFYSIVQDETDEDKLTEVPGLWFPDNDGFLHTHVYIETSTEMRNKNVSAFIIEGVTPYITKVKDAAHVNNIILYHNSKKRKPVTNIEKESIIAKRDSEKKGSISSIRSKPMKGIREAVYECETEQDVLNKFEESSLAGDLTCLLSMWKTKPAPPKPEGGDISWWYEWKRKLFEELTKEDVDPRKIIFYINTLGLGGKSDFVDYMINHVEGVVSIGADSMYHLATTLVDYLASGQKIDIVLVDIPKDGSISSGFYESLEMIKNGKFTSQKFRGKMISIPKPKVVVFTNQIPHLWKLSPDRWDLRFLDPNCNIFHHVEGRELRKGYLESGEDEKFFIDYISNLPIKNKTLIKIRGQE
jgi:hypothetical protein